MTDRVPVSIPTPPPTDTPPDLAALLLIVLSRWRLVFAMAIAGGLVGVVHSLLARSQFVATTTFAVAEARTSGGGGLGAIASQLGGGLAALAGVPTSAQFLRSAVTSREVADSVLLRRIPVVRDTLRRDALESLGDSLDLIQWYGIRDRDRGAVLDDARFALGHAMSVAVADRTGILTLQVTDRDPRVAATVARALVEAVNRFNLQRRQTTSRANREFLERRIVDAQSELRDAENQMRTFLEHNRVVSTSLQFEEDRIRRQITVRQQVYLSLAQDLEQARIDEVKDTPVLTVIDEAIPPSRRNWPRRKLLVIMWTIAGLLAGAGLALLGNWVERMDTGGPESWQSLRRLTRRSRAGQIAS
jgi:uncharacterized protein involved in exopolysaccharide biosynthesis